MDPSRAYRLMHRVIAALAAITIGLLLWHHFGMERVIDLTTRADVRRSAMDDRWMGGTSRVALAHDGRALTMRCRLARTIDWPACKYQFVISDTQAGIDLSEFDAVTFDVAYRGPGRHALRLMVLNFEPGTSTLDNPMSQKINELEFEVPHDGAIRVPLNVLHTATWWIDYMKVPLEATDMRIDNVTRIELLTGAASAGGDHVIELRSLRLHGKWITSGELYMGLMAAWIVCAVSWPLLASLRLHRELDHSSRRLALLGEINAALQLETRELAEQANTDPLTGALNRQGLRAALMNSPALLARPMAVLFADIDHFKRINDRHGHDVGDAVLRDFAAAIHGGIRANDRLVRWGGEEFLIVCPATGAEQGRQLAEKLRAALRQCAWPAGLNVTASFGIAARGENEDIGAVIKRADGVLYAAKAAGRDCVMVAEAPLPPVPAWSPPSTGAHYD
ncbi:diguanylate cyclase [Massilia dura]|uniref:diguanylate cyclase n=1 Tax=Pseudoduganella dura TaxID=321982 RepID=A0A6I3XGA1_9BURK|nr:GGDEF domain-containing protein [Pseudoduganella dura]MUI15497.1 diguanylate cyclase [Pseudoduganella dura]GGY00133.1 GGDEF domain-containing protein [Pseudoduganella dura]